jgi:hypothetical protein
MVFDANIDAMGDCTDHSNHHSALKATLFQIAAQHYQVGFYTKIQK